MSVENRLVRVTAGNAWLEVKGGGSTVVLKENDSAIINMRDPKDYDDMAKNSHPSSSATGVSTDPLALGYSQHQALISDFVHNQNPNKWCIRRAVLAPHVLLSAYTSAKQDNEWLTIPSLSEL